MSSSPTRADVAKLAGVSPSVVSYVINHGPRPVSEKTRKRVTKAIRTLGYRPNQVARALRSTRSSSIGLLLPDAGNPFFWEFVEHVETECLARGYVLFVGTTGNDPEREANYLAEFADRQVDGLIIISSSPTWQFSEDDHRPLPLVLVDRAPVGGRSKVVQSDNYRGAHLAATHLVEVHDSRNVLLLAGPEELESSRLRTAGAAAALEKAGRDHTVINGRFSFHAGYEAIIDAIEQGGGALDFDALFAFTDAQAIGALRACSERHIAVPDELTVVSFDGTELADFVTPSLTTVRQDSRRLAREAVEAVEQLIQERPEIVDGGASTVLTDLDLRLGGSCGCGTSQENRGGSHAVE